MTCSHDFAERARVMHTKECVVCLLTEVERQSALYDAEVRQHADSRRELAAARDRVAELTACEPCVGCGGADFVRLWEEEQERAEAAERERDEWMERWQRSGGNDDAVDREARLRERLTHAVKVLDDAGNHFDHDSTRSAQQAIARWFELWSEDARAALASPPPTEPSKEALADIVDAALEGLGVKVDREKMRAWDAANAPEAKPVKSCNMHKDCDAAEAKAAAEGKPERFGPGSVRLDHCSDEGCDECFGN
jgi:hypothetical protein